VSTRAIYKIDEMYVRLPTTVLLSFFSAVSLIEEYNLPVEGLHNQLDAEFADLDDDKQLKESLTKLEEYDNKFGRSNVVGGSSDPMSEREHQFFDQTEEEEHYYDENGELNISRKDDSYEGDLHANLASMYIAKQDFVAALSHFNQAIRLYEVAGEDESIVMANTKFNLATLNFRIGAYSASAEKYDEALDLYKQIHGDGINPFSLPAQWKGIVDGLDTSILDASSLGALVEGMDGFSNALQGTYDLSEIGELSSDSNNQQLPVHDDSSSDTVGTRSTTTASDDNDTTEKPEPATSYTKNSNDIRTTKATSKQNVKIVLPGGSSFDLGKFLQQNKSTHDEL
jgi:tetratricopeptide (TPR) repeat protein